MSANWLAGDGRSKGRTLSVGLTSASGISVAFRDVQGYSAHLHIADLALASAKVAIGHDRVIKCD